MTTKIDTPALVIDETVVRANIERFQAYCDQMKVKLRPHIKTHKSAYFAQMQLAAGAHGLTFQKIGEDEAFLEEGALDDILITYNIIGDEKLKRLQKLSARTKLSVVADSLTCVKGLANAFNASKPLGVYVECDTGGGRCGVQTPHAAIELAKEIMRSQGLDFKGLMTYPAKGGGRDVDAFMMEAKKHAEAEGVPIENITSGGTPDMYHLSNQVITGYRTGTYIFNDYSLIKGSGVHLKDCAARVYATVVSTPTATRAVIDAGSKILTSDMPFLESYGLIIGREELRISSLSEEHGIIEAESATKLDVGDVIEIIPNHICVTVNMLDEYWVRGLDGRMRTQKVDARGQIK